MAGRLNNLCLPEFGAIKNKGEAYKLFWPDQPEFVRMAARFGTAISPFGVVGEDDVAEGWHIRGGCKLWF
ncbi:putative acyltransferase-like protein, chloroplastic [Iris pallida]|uniref:Acyltransferase-like protein, chloroplastic n=1 Tax=Iris pallida TaxID=29817 RepID=A0AAX6G6L3_IRIPA|nr:putative acyltransferase-like protein, chloroplastic [Iris pallida]